MRVKKKYKNPGNYREEEKKNRIVSLPFQKQTIQKEQLFIFLLLILNIQDFINN